MRRLIQAVLPVLMISIGTLVAVLFSEAGFRAYLLATDPDVFAGPSPEGTFTVFQPSFWEYDEKFGYVYPPERPVDLTSIKDGKIIGCGTIDVVNALGNVGPIVGDYDAAELKVIVFGDSWAAFHVNGRTWPAFLQDVLTERLGKPVHVMNFGRDGYGLLQMFDLAAETIPKFNPDLVLFTFITDDLTRARFWRTVTNIDGDDRVLTSLVAEPNPSLDVAADTAMIDSRATREWCDRTLAAGGQDEVVAALTAKWSRLLDHARQDSYTTPNPYTLSHSYLWNRFVEGDTYHFARREFTPTQNPRVPFSSYAEDEQFVRAVERVKGMGIPLEIMHLSVFNEISKGEEYILTDIDRSLLESLSELTGKTIHETTGYVDMPVEGPERMNHSPDNHHPSLWGMEFYANAVAEMLIRNNHVSGD